MCKKVNVNINTLEEEPDMARVKTQRQHQYVSTKNEIWHVQKSQCQHQYTGRRTRYGTCAKSVATPILGRRMGFGRIGRAVYNQGETGTQKPGTLTA